MLNFKLMPDEEIKIIKNDIKVRANTNNYILTFFLTTKRLVLLKDVNQELVFNEFLSSRTIAIPKNLEVVFDIELTAIKDIIYQDNQNKITFKENANELYLTCENLKGII